MAKKIKDKETKIDKVIKDEIKKYMPFVIGLLVLAVIFMALYFSFQGLGKVTYEGLTFVKEKYGDVQVYHYYYLAELSNGEIRKVDVFLRGNPAENHVPIEGEIVYPKTKNVYLSLNTTGLNKCNYSLIAMSSLTIFLANNNLNVKVGTPDKEESKANNSTYITCSSWPSSPTISIKEGLETKITRTGNLCYNVEVSNCEILPAVEKFIVQSILDAKNVTK